MTAIQSGAAVAAFVASGLFALLNAINIHGQAGAAPPLQFEVASIKPDVSANGVSGDCHGADSNFASGEIGAAIPRGRCVITAARLTHLMGIAYNIPMQRLSGGPDWIGPNRYDIQAKAENPSATHQELIQMLQALLADRFKLKFHRETKEVSGYALVVAKNGPKLRDARNSDERPSLNIRGAAIYKFDAVEGKNLNQNTITAQKTSMSQLADALTNMPGTGPVVDKTGLTGSYDFTLAWEPGESLSTVLQEQLGLRLEAQKVPVEFFVIDSAEKPAEN